jgi:hypothetical protein
MELEDLVGYLTEKYHPKAIILHGSRARGDALDESDYDLALITDMPDLIKPESWNGCALDLDGVSPTEKILKAGQTPIWPCLVLIDDVDGLGERLAKRTHEAFEKGPLPLTREELENRRNFSNRLLQRIQGRGADPLVRFYYLGNFYDRILRYWCEFNQKWTMSVYLLLSFIAKEDPAFYQYLQDLWTEDYQNTALKIHLHLFKPNINI